MKIITLHLRKDLTTKINEWIKTPTTAVFNPTLYIPKWELSYIDSKTNNRSLYFRDLLRRYFTYLENQFKSPVIITTSRSGFIRIAFLWHYYQKETIVPTPKKKGLIINGKELVVIRRLD